MYVFVSFDTCALVGRTFFIILLILATGKCLSASSIVVNCGLSSVDTSLDVEGIWGFDDSIVASLEPTITSPFAFVEDAITWWASTADATIPTSSNGGPEEDEDPSSAMMLESE